MFDLSVRVTPRTSCFKKRCAYKADAVPRETGEAMINFEM